MVGPEGVVPQKSNNEVETSKSRDRVSRFEGSLPQGGIIRQGVWYVGFEGSLHQIGIVRREGNGLGFGTLLSQSGIVRLGDGGTIGGSGIKSNQKGWKCA